MLTDEKFHAYVFADGSASKSDDVGAWAAVAVTASARKVLYGIDFPTTISRCELKPIIEALRWIKQNWTRTGAGFRVCVYSDSEYTIKTLCGEYKRGKNLELWAALDGAASGMVVSYRWRERNSTYYMDFCDALCGFMRKSVKRVATDIMTDPLMPEIDLAQAALPDGAELTL